MNVWPWKICRLYDAEMLGLNNLGKLRIDSGEQFLVSNVCLLPTNCQKEMPRQNTKKNRPPPWCFVPCLTLPEHSYSPWKWAIPKRKRSSSNHPFSGANCWFQRGYFLRLFFPSMLSDPPGHHRLLPREYKSSWGNLSDARVDLGTVRICLFRANYNDPFRRSVTPK